MVLIMNFRDELILKYAHYEETGLRLFAVTLSTCVKSSWYVKKSDLRSLWERHFIYRIKKRLPYKLKSKIDHDFVIESPSCNGGGYHFHGIVALTPEGAERIWFNGALHKQLVRDLDSFRACGRSRPCNVNKYLVEPIAAGKRDSWIQYITKESDLVASSLH